MTRGKSTVKCVRPMKEHYCYDCVETENKKRNLEEQLAKEKKLKQKSTKSKKRKEKIPHSYPFKEILKNQKQIQDQNLHLLQIQTKRKIR